MTLVDCEVFFGPKAREWPIMRIIGLELCRAGLYRGLEDMRR